MSSPTEADLNMDLVNFPAEQLYPYEVYWPNRYVWLKDNGYQLRSRYNPEWVPSSTDTDKSWIFARMVKSSWCENCSALWDKVCRTDRSRFTGTPYPNGCDSDFRRSIANVKTLRAFQQIRNYRFFSEEPQRNHARNHCIPFEGLLKMPGEEGVIVALPLLNHWDDLSLILLVKLLISLSRFSRYIIFSQIILIPYWHKNRA